MRNIENLPNDNTARSYTFHEHVGNVAYAATIALPTLRAVNEQDIYFATLTGAATINAAAAIGNLVKGDRVNLIIPSDATGRTVTWGTNIKSSAATLAIAASGKTRVEAIFDGTDLVIR